MSHTTMSIYTHINNQHKIDTVNSIFNMKRSEFKSKLKAFSKKILI